MLPLSPLSSFLTFFPISFSPLRFTPGRTYRAPWMGSGPFETAAAFAPLFLGLVRWFAMIDTRIDGFLRIPATPPLSLFVFLTPSQSSSVQISRQHTRNMHFPERIANPQSSPLLFRYPRNCVLSPTWNRRSSPR